jgi:hypothetical protein
MMVESSERLKSFWIKPMQPRWSIFFSLLVDWPGYDSCITDDENGIPKMSELVVRTSGNGKY